MCIRDRPQPAGHLCARKPCIVALQAPAHVAGGSAIRHDRRVRPRPEVRDLSATTQPAGIRVDRAGPDERGMPPPRRAKSLGFASLWNRRQGGAVEPGFRHSH